MDPKPAKLPVDVDMQPVEAKPLRLKRKPSKSRRKRKKRGVIAKVKTALWKAGKRRYSKRRICRGGTKCSF